MSAAHPDSEVEVWAQDEARIGLMPILRRIWAPKKSRPIATVNLRYEWVYIYGFVHPSSGRVVWLLLPKMNAGMMNIALKRFAEEVGAGEKKRIVILLDQAPSHTAKKLVIPEGIHLVFQPPYSPEVQPAEHLWPFLRESVANKAPDNIEQLEQMLVTRCRQLDQQPHVIQSATRFHWWPQDIAAA